MKRERRITKRERKAINGVGPSGEHKHIHCISCGRHIDGGEFHQKPAAATWITCDHGSRFPTCTTCMDDARARLAEHDRTGHNVEVAAAHH